MLRMFGVDSNGASVAAFVHGFDPLLLRRGASQLWARRLRGAVQVAERELDWVELEREEEKRKREEEEDDDDDDHLV